MDCQRAPSNWGHKKPPVGSSCSHHPKRSRCLERKAIRHLINSPARGHLMKRKLHVISCPRSRQRVWFGDTGLAVPPRVSLLILQTAGSFTCVLQTLQYMFRKANCPCRRIIRVGTGESCNPLHYVSTAAPYAAFRTTAAAAIFALY